MDVRGGSLERLALFAACVAFGAFSMAAAGVAETFGIGGYTKALTVAALLSAPLSLHKRTFGLALALLNALVIAMLLLFLLALGGAAGYADAARALTFPRPHL